jgi:hypothetical protein
VCSLQKGVRPLLPGSGGYERWEAEVEEPLVSHQRDDGLMVWSIYEVHVYVIVAKIFYCGGSFGRLGVLRAVMPFSEREPLMFDEFLGYVGQFFPEGQEKLSAQIVIEIAPDEEDESWKAGFYLIEKGPLHFEALSENSARLPVGPFRA